MCACSVLNHVWLFCDSMDCSPPGFSVHGILQARTLGWVAVSYATGSSWPRGQTCISCVSCIGRQILYHCAKERFWGEEKKQTWKFPGGLDSKESACSAGGLGSIPGSGRFPGEGHGYPLQYSCLENPMDRGAWRATVHGVAKVGHDWARILFQKSNILQYFSPSAYLVLCWTS